MLTIHQASRQRRRAGTAPKTGLAIAGGGPLGAIYELGALRALDESLDGLKLHQLDVYVGVSAGAFIAASLANRITTSELCRVFLADEQASIRFQPERFLRPAYHEYFARAARAPSVLSETLLRIVRHPLDFSISRTISSLGRLIPSGVFDNETIHHFLEQAFTTAERSNSFDDLDCRLYVVAVDLDSGAAVRFGSPENRDLPISRAVQASAALPGLYPPVSIGDRHFVDGALRRTLHASAALDEGVSLLIGINPLVPFDSGDGHPDSGAAQRLINGGLPLILSQTFRAMIQSRMEIGFRKYRDSHPRADLVLMEPDREDAEIFFTNLFSYSSRKALCEHAYQTTRRDLLARADQLDDVLEVHGASLRRDLLSDTSRSLLSGLHAAPHRHARVARELDSALEKLEETLSAMR